MCSPTRWRTNTFFGRQRWKRRRLSSLARPINYNGSKCRSRPRCSKSGDEGAISVQIMNLG